MLLSSNLCELFSFCTDQASARFSGEANTSAIPTARLPVWGLVIADISINIYIILYILFIQRYVYIHRFSAQAVRFFLQ